MTPVVANAAEPDHDGPPRPKPKTAAELGPDLWSTAVTIRFGRCDAAGMVYTPHYFDLFIAATEAWYEEALGIDYYGLLSRPRIGLGYAHASCDFFAPSRMGETLQVVVAIGRIGRTSVELLLHAFKDGRERVRGRFVSVATSLDSQRPILLPPEIVMAFRAYQRRCGGTPTR